MYTRDLKPEDVRRLFTHDTPDAYNYFARGRDEDAFAGLPWWKRLPLQFRRVFIALHAAAASGRRALYLAAVAVALLGLPRPVPRGSAR